MPHARALIATLSATITASALLSCKDREADPAPAEQAEKSSGASIMLRGKFEAQPGSKLAVSQTLTIDGADILLQGTGKGDTTGTMSITQSERQTVRYLKGGGREIDIAEGGSELTTQFADEQPIEEVQPDKLAGKTVVATQAPDGGWSYTIKGEPGTPPPAGFNAADLRSDELYPTEWRDLGGTWSPDPSAVGALLGPGFQLTEGDIDMRLINYVKRGGQPCGEIVIDIEAKGLFRSGKARQDISIKLKGKIYRSLNLYQDLEADLDGSIEMSQRLGNADVRIEGPVRLVRKAVWTPAPPE